LFFFDFLSKKNYILVLTFGAFYDSLFPVMRDIEQQRKEWKKEWVDMPKAIGENGELAPSWETFKRMKQREASRMAEVDRCEALTTQHLN